MWRRIPTAAGTTARHSSSYRRAAYATAGATSVALAGYYYNVQRRQQEMLDDFELPPHSSMIYLEPQQVAHARDPTRPHAFWAPPSRDDMLHMLQNGPGTLLASKQAGSKGPTPTPVAPADAVSSTSKDDDDSDVFDLLIIGGGATGAGCAVDAATRGLKVAMVERDDYSSGKKRRETDKRKRSRKQTERRWIMIHLQDGADTGVFFSVFLVTITGRDTENILLGQLEAGSNPPPQLLDK